jgi:YesN/AraC family two-component response regulator
MIRAFFVDDEPLVLNAFMASPVFTECGYTNVGHATHPPEALTLIINKKPDVVFTDLKMPGMNGVELMQALRRMHYSGEFIIVSAYGEFEESRRFFKLGGFDYLVKPVAERELQKMLLSLSEKIRAQSIHTVPFTPSPELNKITAYLLGHLSAKHSLESVGAKFDLKTNYICNLFSRYLNTTFVSYITHIKMAEAANLLKKTDKTVKEIALLCGYPDYFYFCRVFKDIHNCTPTIFREAAR